MKKYIGIILIFLFACSPQGEYKYEKKFILYLKDVHQVNIKNKKQSFVLLNLNCKSCITQDFNKLLNEIKLSKNSENNLILCGSEAEYIKSLNFDSNLYDKRQYNKYKLGLSKVLIIKHENNEFISRDFTYFRVDTVSKYLNLSD